MSSPIGKEYSHLRPKIVSETPSIVVSAQFSSHVILFPFISLNSFFLLLGMRKFLEIVDHRLLTLYYQGNKVARSFILSMARFLFFKFCCSNSANKSCRQGNCFFIVYDLRFCCHFARFQFVNTAPAIF